MYFAAVHWEKTKDDSLSNAGTTAATVLILQQHLFVAHVGDSLVVLATKLPDKAIMETVLTAAHRPEDRNECAEAIARGKNRI